MISMISLEVFIFHIFDIKNNSITRLLMLFLGIIAFITGMILFKVTSKCYIKGIYSRFKTHSTLKKKALEYRESNIHLKRHEAIKSEDSESMSYKSSEIYISNSNSFNTSENPHKEVDYNENDNNDSDHDQNINNEENSSNNDTNEISNDETKSNDSDEDISINNLLQEKIKSFNSIDKICMTLYIYVC